ncbi:MAG: prepilin peptidase [Actinomycetota bacterium]
MCTNSVNSGDGARLDSTNPVAGGRLPGKRATERLGSSRQVKQIAVSEQSGKQARLVAPVASSTIRTQRAGAVATVGVTTVLLCGTATVTTPPLASVITIAALLPAAVVDIHERRLPNPLVGLAALALATALTLGTIGGASWPVASVVAGLAVAALPPLALHLVSPDAIGFGDVKAAAVLGAAVGVVDWRIALVMLALAAGGAATIASILRWRSIAFGPPLVVAASAALAIQPSVLGVLGS